MLQVLKIVFLIFEFVNSVYLSFEPLHTIINNIYIYILQTSDVKTIITTKNMSSQLLAAIPTNELLNITKDDANRFFDILAVTTGDTDCTEMTSSILQRHDHSPAILFLSLEVTKYCIIK